MDNKVHEIITVTCSNGIGGKHMAKYIVVAPTTSKAVSMVCLKAGEEIVEAREMVNHHLVMEGKNANSNQSIR